MTSAWELAWWLPALCAGLCAAMWVDSPAQHLARAARRSEPAVGHGQLTSRWVFVAARHDAAPLRRRLFISVVGALVTGTALQAFYGTVSVLSWVLAPVLVVTCTVMLGRREPAGYRREQRRLIQELPQALELLASCLAAGMPVRQATRSVAECFTGPVAADLTRVLMLVDLGASDAEAWRTLRTHPQWGAAAIDLARSVESGTMMAQVLVHHARDARTRHRADLEVRAKAVGVRSVLPLMTCFLPAFMLIGVVPTVASAVMNALS